MMTGNDIRRSFLDYFRKQSHTIVKSSSLVPDKDPTLLFTNAGMVQFKNVFLGQERLPYSRAASSQKCLRISGKHNDLEAVGRDTYHHTFFEMLGNWSFGDYYKAEAIEWAWELLTREWSLPKEKLWATVYLDDDEAERLWAKISRLPAERIRRFGEKENFWEMGETGPCGPCSEIHLDRGPEACDRKGLIGHVCQVNGDCARYIELWNLVFIQYNRKDNRELEELPSKHVDTGMGLERITAVLQNVLSNYDIDYMRELTAAVETLTGKRYGDDAAADISFRVIDDHARAVSFLIADGVMPSNEGRGYVLRRLLRRAARHGRLIGLKEPFLYHIADTVGKVMGQAYPELRTEASRIREIIRNEEERFSETLEKGLVLLENAAAKLKEENKKVLPGGIAFRLYDTFGFPLDLTEDILRAENISVDQQGFENLMETQRSRGREARTIAINVYDQIRVSDAGNLSLSGGAPEVVRGTIITPAAGSVTADDGSKVVFDIAPVQFIGYDHLDGESRVVAIYGHGHGKQEAADGEEIDLIAAETPFYGESGGQVGDRGIIESSRGDQFEVFDTQRPTPQLTVHRGRIRKGRFQIDDRVHLMVDPKHRQRTMLNHSATHILHAVMREQLGSHVRQAGSLVTPDRLRFDFNHTGAISDEKLADIETTVNDRIRQDAAVLIEETSFDDALRKGALAFFGDKYGDRVRLVKIGDFSTELCGGTHVHHSGQIGIFKLHAEAGVAAGVRRVEAVTGEGALGLIRRYENDLKQIGHMLRAGEDSAVERVRKLLQQQKELEKEIERLRAQLGKNQIPDILARKEKINGIDVLISCVDGVDPKQLRELADQLKEQMPHGFIFLASQGDNGVNLVASASTDLAKRIHAGNIIKEVAPIVGGGGGGRPDFAQAGGKNPARTDEALAEVKKIVSAKLS
jgi:alanyl-tRNA synthetase